MLEGHADTTGIQRDFKDSRSQLFSEPETDGWMTMSLLGT